MKSILTRTEETFTQYLPVCNNLNLNTDTHCFVWLFQTLWVQLMGQTHTYIYLFAYAFQPTLFMPESSCTTASTWCPPTNASMPRSWGTATLWSTRCQPPLCCGNATPAVRALVHIDVLLKGPNFGRTTEKVIVRPKIWSYDTKIDRTAQNLVVRNNYCF
jgi:hypothetical protein